MNRIKLDTRSIEIRKKIIQIIEYSRRGHIGSALSTVEILGVLYDHILKYRPKEPMWLKRDRFILSKGHGCLAIYAILADKGFFAKEELKKFCKEDGILGGHPEFGKVPGIEASTGALGHGLSIGVGIAINGVIDEEDYRTFVLLGDGECDEGSVWEAAMCASKHRLSRLTAIIDYNKAQCYGSSYEVQDLEPFVDKWKSFGWAVEEVDGHNIEELKSLFLKLPLHQEKPSAIICHTVKGKGIPFLENNYPWHHQAIISDEQIRDFYNILGGKP